VADDLGPNKKKIAALLRMLGSSGSERRNAFAALERLMQNEGVDWSDLGNWIEHGKYTEAEMLEFGQAMRAEGVEVGTKIGLARDGGGNGHLTLPKPAEMAEFCVDRLTQLKDRNQREFVSDMHGITRRGRRTLSLGQLGYLVSLYIQIGGRTC